MPDKSVRKRQRKLHLSQLAKGLPGITPAFGQLVAEASAVSLDNQKHSTGAAFTVKGEFEEVFEICWPKVTAQGRRCWNDQEVATEHGAYGIAFLLILKLTSYTIIERSKKGTGFDYWLGDSNDMFQRKARLEVSGIFAGDENTLSARVTKKLKQTQRSAGLLPAFVIVVEFSTPQSRVVKRS